ncbi:hypothetical protein MT_57057 [Pseudomonas phage phiPto-bp6g]|nr:hypothetical protein MT_57057 [Pseudomonas phage phiPto-bp6g]
MLVTVLNFLLTLLVVNVINPATKTMFFIRLLVLVGVVVNAVVLYTELFPK